MPCLKFMKFNDLCKQNIKQNYIQINIETPGRVKLMKMLPTEVNL